jgi:plasmid stability protein
LIALVAVAAVSIRNLDERVRERIRLRAARHGRSMEEDAKDLYTSAITVAEIRCGIERLPEGRRKIELRSTAVEVFGAFADRVLAFDAAAAEPVGRPGSANDGRGLGRGLGQRATRFAEPVLESAGHLDDLFQGVSGRRPVAIA